MNPGLLAMLLAPVVAMAQTAATPPAATPHSATSGQAQAAASPLSVRVYTNAQLHLTFAYLAELVPRDAKLAVPAERRVIYGEDTTPDSDYAKLPGCSTTLLSVGTESPAAGAHPATATAVASVTVFDVDVGCLPPKAFRNKKAMDEVLMRLVVQGTTFLGMMPIEQPLFYSIQDHRVRFAAAQGTPASTNGLQTAGDQLIAVAATALNGHVVCWIIEADDLPLFNRLLASPVDFGGGAPRPLFPTQFSGSE